MFLDLAKCYPILEDIDKEPEKKEKKKGKVSKASKKIEKDSTHGSQTMITEVPAQTEAKCSKRDSESGSKTNLDS